MKKDKKSLVIKYPLILTLFCSILPIGYLVFFLTYFEKIVPMLCGKVDVFGTILMWGLVVSGIFFGVFVWYMFAFQIIIDGRNVIYRDIFFRKHHYTTHDIQKIVVKTHWDFNTAATFKFYGKNKKLFSATGNQDLIRWAGIHGIPLKKRK